MYNPSVDKGSFKGHSDAVWDLAMHPRLGLLLSCSSDRTCQLWNRWQSSSEVTCIPYAEELGLPTSVDFVHHHLWQLVAGNNTAQAVVYDIVMCKTATKLDSAKSYNHHPHQRTSIQGPLLLNTITPQ